MATIQADGEASLWQRVGFGQLPTLSVSGVSTFTPVSSAGLGVLFDSAWRSESVPALSALHDACTGFVRRLRGDGFTPEKVLVALKREIREGGIVHRTPSLCSASLDAGDLERTRVYERLFRWFLEACFDS